MSFGHQALQWEWCYLQNRSQQRKAERHTFLILCKDQAQYNYHINIHAYIFENHSHIWHRILQIASIPHILPLLGVIFNRYKLSFNSFWWRYAVEDCSSGKRGTESSPMKWAFTTSLNFSDTIWPTVFWLSFGIRPVMPNFLLLLLNNVIHGSSHRLLFCEIPVFLFLVKKLEGYVWGLCFIEPSGCRKYSYLIVT